MRNRFDKLLDNRNVAPLDSGASFFGDVQLLPIFVYLFLLVLMLCYLVHTKQWKRLPTKIDRTKLFKLYRVDGRTFKKWIHFFIPSFEKDFQTKQKIHSLDALLIVFTLGIPQEETPVLSKGMIVQKGEGSYRSLRQSIKQNILRWPIEMEAYKQLSVFPPLVSKLLLEVYS